MSVPTLAQEDILAVRSTKLVFRFVIWGTGVILLQLFVWPNAQSRYILLAKMTLVHVCSRVWASQDMLITIADCAETLARTIQAGHRPKPLLSTPLRHVLMPVPKEPITITTQMNA